MAQNATYRVFVYGIFKTQRHHENPPAEVPGTLFMSGIALGKFVAEADSVIRGEVLTVDDATLERWDWIEGIDRERPGRGMYRRIKVTTTDGERCWAYHFNGSVSGAAVLPDGLWLGHGMGQ